MPPPPPAIAAPEVAPPPPAAEAGVEETPDLEPGTLRAFGLLMPVGSTEQFHTEQQRIFFVVAPFPRVMRYLQRRLEITTGDIHPLGALVRNARLRTAPEGQILRLDVGVRDEGERTVVTLWNRTAVAVPPRSMNDGLRAAGFDPATGRPLPENNY